jgi:hypothetical protein
MVKRGDAERDAHLMGGLLFGTWLRHARFEKPGPTEEQMRKLFIFTAAAVALSAAAIQPSIAQQGWNHGCFRFGETGYHWYNFCVGPDFVYPHHQVCDHTGWCSYS